MTKKILFFIAVMFCISEYSISQSKLQNHFDKAYSLYPNLPNGILEALSYANTRISNVQPSVDLEPHHGPERFGFFGLIEDGKGYFKNNLIAICNFNNISPSEFKNNEELQILSVSKYLSSMAQQKGLNRRFESWNSVLKEFSEIPSNNLINKFAQDLYTYQFYYSLQNGFQTDQISFSAKTVDLNQIYSPSTLKILKAKNVTVQRNNISANGTTYNPASSFSPDYPPALYTPACTSNYSSRSGTVISAVTVHTVQGTYAGCISWFQNCTAGVSAHYVVRSSDGQVTQMVLEVNKAWHVKTSNPYTVGIEHEGYVDNASWYTDAMYQQSANLTKDICTSNTINPKTCYNGPSSSGVVTLHDSIKIKGHQHFPVQTHTDPGINWNWPKYYALINPTQCTTPSNLAVNSIQLNSALLSWNTVTGANSYTVQIRVKGATTWLNYTVTTNSYTAINLAVGTKYEWQVSTNCTSGSSTYSSINNFKTLVSSSINTNCSGQFTDTGNITANYSNNEHYTFTVQPANAQSVTVTFSSFGLEANFDYMYVYNGPSTSSPLIGTYTGTTSPGTITSSGSSLTFRFYSDGATVSWGWNATWSCTLPVCTTPAGLTTSNITASTALASWGAVSGVTGYLYQRRIQGTTTWTQINTSLTNVNNTTLTPSTIYEWQVASVCSWGNSNFSALSTFTTLPPSYCNSNGQSTTDEYLAKVQFCTINNTTGAGAGGYTNYTSISTDVYASYSYPVTLTAGYTGTANPEYFRVWIDYNNDKDFDDAGELAYDAGATSTSPVSGNIIIPANAVITSTRMRVSMKYNGASTQCESFQYGEVEDYTVNIKATPVCSVPTGLTSSAITSVSATLGWTALGSANSYNLRYRMQGAATWINLTSATNSKSLSGLNANTIYEFQVGSVCNVNSSGYSASATFTTSAATSTYCNSNGQSQADEWIASVKLGTINNTSTASAGGYGNYTNLTTDLGTGTTSVIYLKPGYTSSAYPEYFRVWIDLNNDKDFSDAGELVYDAGATTTTSASGNITIPSSTTLGNKRMRVSMKYNGAPTECESFQYGEVEDYTVNIITGTIITPPKVIQVGAGTTTNNTLVYDTYYMDHRFQMIVTKAELQAAGWVAGLNYVGYVAFQTGSASTQVMNAFTVKMKNITGTAFSTTSFITGATQVYSANYTATSNGWNTHTYSSGFQYDGTSNLLIEVCFNNSSYTSSSYLYGSTQTSYKTLGLRVDIKDLGACSNTTGTLNYFRPNVKLKFMSTASGRYADTQFNPSEIVNDDINLYPNPSNGKITISYQFKDETRVQTQLFDMKATLISDFGYETFHGEMKKEYDLNSTLTLKLTSGFYLMRFSTADQVLYRKIILQK